MNLYYQKVKSKVGILHFVADDKKLLALAYDSVWDKIKKHYPELQNQNSDIIQQAQAELNEYLGGKRTCFTVPYGFDRGTEFQKKVWKALTQIPFGKTITYSEQAQKIEKPDAVRAVGMTNGMNPISILVPCHRVIGKSGKLTGYAGGISIKAMLLKIEGIDSLNV